MSLKKRSLSRKERLCKNTDIKRMLKFAKRIDGSGIKLIYCLNNLKWNRFAIMLKKGFHSAVHRNREKRIAKECYRNLKNDLQFGIDILILLFPGTNSYSKRFSQIFLLFRKADLLLNNETK